MLTVVAAAVVTLHPFFLHSTRSSSLTLSACEAVADDRAGGAVGDVDPAVASPPLARRGKVLLSSDWISHTCNNRKHGTAVESTDEAEALIPTAAVVQALDTPWKGRIVLVRGKAEEKVEGSPVDGCVGDSAPSNRTPGPPSATAALRIKNNNGFWVNLQQRENEQCSRFCICCESGAPHHSDPSIDRREVLFLWSLSSSHAEDLKDVLERRGGHTLHRTLRREGLGVDLRTELLPPAGSSSSPYYLVLRIRPTYRALSEAKIRRTFRCVNSYVRRFFEIRVPDLQVPVPVPELVVAKGVQGDFSDAAGGTDGEQWTARQTEEKQAAEEEELLGPRIPEWVDPEEEASVARYFMIPLQQASQEFACSRNFAAPMQINVAPMPEGDDDDFRVIPSLCDDDSIFASVIMQLQTREPANGGSCSFADLSPSEQVRRTAFALHSVILADRAAGDVAEVDGAGWALNSAATAVDALLNGRCNAMMRFWGRTLEDFRSQFLGLAKLFRQERLRQTGRWMFQIARDDFFVVLKKRLAAEPSASRMKDIEAVLQTLRGLTFRRFVRVTFGRKNNEYTTAWTIKGKFVLPYRLCSAMAAGIEEFRLLSRIVEKAPELAHNDFPLCVEDFVP